MTEGQADKEERPASDWRDLSKPWNSEDDLIAHGWKRGADGVYEKVSSDGSQQDLSPDITNDVEQGQGNE